MIGSVSFDTAAAIALACVLVWGLWRRYVGPMLHMAYADDLTGYANRRMLLRRLEKISKKKMPVTSYGAVLVMDLDNFKQVRPAQGYAWGGRLLRLVADRVHATLQPGDLLAREDGDCFVVLPITTWTDRAQACQAMDVLAARLQDSLRNPFLLDGQECYLSACIGITVVEQGSGQSIDKLMQALAALAQAKAKGRNKVNFFDEQERLFLQKRVALQTDLHHAVEREQLQLYFQPQVDRHGDVVAAEVLLRWFHPERGLVPPLDFISLAEESGFIVRLGQWVLDQACARLCAWKDDPRMQHLQLSINVSARQFLQPGFVDMVRASMQRYKVPAHRLTLELTESVMLEQGETVIQTMHALRALGVGLSLDDFGTGYSSFTYLSRLPLSQIKVDKMFLHDVALGGHNSVIVQTLIHMGHSLGLDVVAEGVETAVQRDYLHSKSCSLYQGYFFSKPVPLQEFEQLVLVQPSRGFQAVN